MSLCLIEIETDSFNMFEKKYLYKLYVAAEIQMFYIPNAKGRLNHPANLIAQLT